MKANIYTKQTSASHDGFTLVELLIAAAVGTSVAFITGSIILDSIKSTARGEAIQRLREDWNRATTLLESEISISQSIQSSNLILDSTEQKDCPYLTADGTLKLRIKLPGKLPDILYGTEKFSNLPPAEVNQWIGGTTAGVLIRCGPQLTITKTGSGDYLEQTPYQQSIILDDLDLTIENGLKVNQNSRDSKLVRFELVMNDTNARTNNNNKKSYQIGSAAFSRINDVPPVPNETSICSKICKQQGILCSTVANDSVITIISTTANNRNFIIPSKSIMNSNTTTVCTNREVKQGDSIKADDANYVIDATPTPEQPVKGGVLINGGQFGRNILLGTSMNDTINGGSFDDVLVGRNGNDILKGEGGNDNFLPWNKENSNSNSTIYGGIGLDRVYIKDQSKNYSASSCDESTCTITGPQGGSLTMYGVEVLVYNDKAMRLKNL